jgi:serine phosphatase RsbU (regulator of sigma subunit)
VGSDERREHAAGPEALALAVEAGGIGTFAWDARTGEVTWDAQLERLFGLTPGAFGGTYEDWLVRLHPDDRERVAAVVAGAVDAGRGYTVVHRVLVGGEERWLECRSDLIAGPDGEVAGAHGVTIDVTDREVTAAQVRRLSDQLATLAVAGIELSSTLEPEPLLRRLAELVVPRLADACEIDLVEPSGEVRRIVFAQRGDRDRIRRRELEPLPEEPSHPIRKVLDGAGPMMLDIAEDGDDAFGPEAVETSARAMGVTMATIAPMEVRSRTIGAIALAVGGRRTLDEHDLELTVELARRAALAYDNATLYRSQRAIAELLQSALLSSRPEPVPGVELCARYLPAQVEGRVGGDWWDTVLIDGQLVVTIGDVIGHGIVAAGAMGRLRVAARAYAMADDDLTVVNERLSEFAVLDDETAFASALLLRLDTATGVMRATAAGHPPPLLLTKDGVRELSEVSTPLLGCPGDRSALVEVHLDDGDTVVLYTDGLYERRGEHVGERLSELARSVARHAGAKVDELCDALIEEMVGDEPQADDIAVVVLRRTPDAPAEI